MAECPEVTDRSRIKKADDVEMIEKAADALGMSAECKTKAKQASKVKTESIDVYVGTPWGAGGANAARGESTLDTELTAAGCSPMSLTLSTMTKEINNINCAIQKDSSKDTTTITAGSKITIQTVAPDSDTIIAILANGRHNQEILQAATASPPVAEPKGVILRDLALAGVAGNLIQTVSDGMTAQFAVAAQTYLNSLEILRRSNADMADATPIRASIKNSTISQSISTNVAVKKVQNISEATKTKVKNSADNVTRAVTEDKMKQLLGAGAVGDQQRKLTNEKHEETLNDTSTTMQSTAKKNTVTIGSNNEITLTVEGSIDGSTISQDSNMLIDLLIDQTISKAVSAGRSTAAKLTSEHVKRTIADITSAGMEEIVKAGADGQVGVIDAAVSKSGDAIEALGLAVKATLEGGGAAFKGLGEGAGAAAQGAGEGAGALLGGLMIIPIMMVIGAIAIPGGISYFAGGAVAKAIGMEEQAGLVRIGMAVLLIALTVGIIMSTIGFGFGDKDDSRKSATYGTVNAFGPAVAANKQTLLRENRYSGDRTAREIRPVKKINQSNNYSIPTNRIHVNNYNRGTDIDFTKSDVKHSIHMRHKQGVYNPIIYNMRV